MSTAGLSEAQPFILKQNLNNTRDLLNVLLANRGAWIFAAYYPNLFMMQFRLSSRNDQIESYAKDIRAKEQVYSLHNSAGRIAGVLGTLLEIAKNPQILETINLD